MRCGWHKSQFSFSCRNEGRAGGTQGCPSPSASARTYSAGLCGVRGPVFSETWTDGPAFQANTSWTRGPQNRCASPSLKGAGLVLWRQRPQRAALYALPSLRGLPRQSHGKKRRLSGGSLARCPGDPCFRTELTAAASWSLLPCGGAVDGCPWTWGFLLFLFLIPVGIRCGNSLGVRRSDRAFLWLTERSRR